jgi:hypothetical protein
MQLSDLQEHLKLIERDIVRTKKRTGDGHSHTVERDGQVNRFIITGVPHLDDLVDSVKHTIVDLWSLKDYLLKMLMARGYNEKKAKGLVYKHVRGSRSLKFCADLANGTKHADLNDGGWTKLHPKFSKGVYQLRIERDPHTGLGIGSGVKRLTCRRGDGPLPAMRSADVTLRVLVP